MRRRDFLSRSLAAGLGAGLPLTALPLTALPSTALAADEETDAASAGGSFFRFLTGWAHTTAFPVGTLIASAISSSGAYYREVNEVLNEKAALTGKSLRVSGNIVTESVKYDAAALDLSFSISATSRCLPSATTAPSILRRWMAQAGTR